MERVSDSLFGWACKCFVTRLNFLIAGLVFTFMMYVLSETTLLFEHIAHYFAGVPLPDSNTNTKSLEKFLAEHHTILCLAGPALILLLVTSHYTR